jgi:hypothetical protein
MLTNKMVDKKMIGLWQMFRLPSLSASLRGDRVRFAFIHDGKEKDLILIPSLMFMQLEPVEIRDIIERSLLKFYNIDGTKFRSDLKGFSRNPFSSQK